MTAIDAKSDVELFLDDVFTYHAPFGDQPTRYGKIRERGKLLALEILSCTPESREQHEALDHVRAAIMWANSAIACNERPSPAVPADTGAPAPSAAAHVPSDNTTRPQPANAAVPVAGDATASEAPPTSAMIVP